jgi:hypothetical protein
LSFFGYLQGAHVTIILTNNKRLGKEIEEPRKQVKKEKENKAGKMVSAILGIRR